LRRIFFRPHGIVFNFRDAKTRGVAVPGTLGFALALFG
jgi:hypothetical protein